MDFAVEVGDEDVGNWLQGAARQAQAKADEIAKMINESEQLKIVNED